MVAVIGDPPAIDPELILSRWLIAAKPRAAKVTHEPSRLAVVPLEVSRSLGFTRENEVPEDLGLAVIVVANDS